MHTNPSNKNESTKEKEKQLMVKKTMEIKFKDSWVWVIEAKGNWEINPQNCFCCEKSIKKGEAMLLINNYKYIPNMLLHKECFNNIEEPLESFLNKIEESYKQYKNMNKVFR